MKRPYKPHPVCPICYRSLTKGIPSHSDCVPDWQHRQHWAISQVGRAVKDGRLVPAKTLTCVDCGNPAQCYDHRDYRKPLDVQPVCRPCNRTRGRSIDYPTETRNEA